MMDRRRTCPVSFMAHRIGQLAEGKVPQCFSRGGVKEANPVKGVVTKPVVFWSVKAAMALALVLATERMWKTNKAGAIAVMVVSNGMMAAVAAHNAKVLNRVR
jgi:hypothetical protein